MFSGQIEQSSIMSTMVPLPNESTKMAEVTTVSIPIDDQEENDRKDDEKLLTELRVNQFDLKDRFSSSTDN